ncbi:hypothetical protein [Cupriavidus sp. CP313]
MRARSRPPDAGYRWLWQLSAAGWGHCGLAYVSGALLAPRWWPAREAMPLRDRYSSRRTALVLYTFAYRGGGAPADTMPPRDGFTWRYQCWSQGVGVA